MHVDTPADTFLALPGSGRGLIWVNGFLLGRYWEIGPQVTLYCPAPLLRAGGNTVTVLELERLGGDAGAAGPPRAGTTGGVRRGVRLTEAARLSRGAGKGVRDVMPEGWQWDRTLFQGSAAYYERGRLPYAAGLPRSARRRPWAWTAGADSSTSAAARGSCCSPMARFFTEVVGVDPDEDMLAEAERQAVRRGVTNARWVAARAEDLPAGLGEFRVVVFAQSFHWTDRERVAATVLEMLEPGGAFVHVSDLKDPLPDPAPPPSPAPPYDRVGDLVRRYLGPVRRAGRGVLVDGTPGGEGLVIERAGFEDRVRLVVPAGDVVTRTSDDIVAWTFSRSDAAPHLFGDRLAEFERDLRALLEEAAPDHRFAERLPATEIRTWRKPLR